jgi:hypothetical protein
MAVRPPCPENLAAGQPSTSHRPISRFTPRIAAKLRGWLGYLLGNLSLKGIEPKRPQSKGIADLGPLGQELEQLENPTRIPQEIALKTPPRRSQERAPKTPKTKMGERTQGLEEPRRIIYTY